MKASFYLGEQRIETGVCTPVPPGPGQVQIRVSHVGICGTDLHIVHGKMDHRVTFPQILGHETSGVIAATGEGVSGWREGDRVTVMPLDPCGQCPACRAGHSHICQKLKFIGIDAPGALQSYWTVPAHTLHRLPESLPLDLGALIEPIAVACHDVRLGEVRAGEFAVVQGAGPIGTLVALVAAQRGARVLVTEVNPHRVEMARSLGLDAVDPREVDVVEAVNERTGGAGADVVFEVSGSQAGSDLMTQIAKVRGRIVVVAIFAAKPQVDLFRFFWRELRLCGARVYEHEDFEEAIALAASGRLPLEQLVTERRPIEEVAAAVERLEGGGAVMKILIRCED
ncbi:MAG: alcohol dehydrogenase catalytic domain-containing protein [Bryobacterales bacterium]|nr:alcohol dehydrogenase catalytic domain-containing protein [Bryobacterales bacterium]